MGPHPLVVITGNPNSGKTALFNALTGLRAKVGNYPGVTVERRQGSLQGAPDGEPVAVLDLPGSYSLSPQSPDEQIARDALLHRLPGVREPSLVIAVVDATNLERNLYYATQAIELGYPTVVALNMMDEAKAHGLNVDAGRLAEELGVAVFPLVAVRQEGVSALRRGILHALGLGVRGEKPPRFCQMPGPLEDEVAGLQNLPVPGWGRQRNLSRMEALLLLSDEQLLAGSPGHYPPAVLAAVLAARPRLEAAGVDWRNVPIRARYARVAAIQHAVVTHSRQPEATFSDRLDRVLTHRVWGALVFLLLMALAFQGIFTFAKLPMEVLEHGVEWVGGQIGRLIPPGDLHSLLAGGVVAGVGAVVVFLPQICLLFLFIGVLEDSGYMARAAFLMDRLMSRVGLHGKSFIPLLSSFGCAVPGILAARTIESPRDRLVTVLVAPLMSCSARLPVYTLLIAASIPERRVLGFFKLTGLVMLAMYLLGIGVAVFMAWVFKRTLLKGAAPVLIVELPPYRRPTLTALLRHVWERGQHFLRRAGTVILGVNILLWFLAAYPRDAATERAYAQARRSLATAPAKTGPDAAEPAPARRDSLARLEARHASERLVNSFVGRLGRVLEPLLKPLGFDWKIGIGIVSSFAARELFVSTVSVVYNASAGDAPGAAAPGLVQTLRAQVRPDGRPLYSPLTSIALMVFYAVALQCASTVAVVRRETNSWKWAAFQWAYLGSLAWLLALLTYQGGRLLGWQ
jgi:ferrous iron transport protein B